MGLHLHGGSARSLCPFFGGGRHRTAPHLRHRAALRGRAEAGRGRGGVAMATGGRPAGGAACGAQTESGGWGRGQAGPGRLLPPPPPPPLPPSLSPSLPASLPASLPPGLPRPLGAAPAPAWRSTSTALPAPAGIGAAEGRRTAAAARPARGATAPPARRRPRRCRPKRAAPRSRRACGLPRRRRRAAVAQVRQVGPPLPPCPHPARPLPPWAPGAVVVCVAVAAASPSPSLSPSLLVRFVRVVIRPRLGPALPVLEIPWLRPRGLPARKHKPAVAHSPVCRPPFIIYIYIFFLFGYVSGSLFDKLTS